MTVTPEVIRLYYPPYRKLPANWLEVDQRSRTSLVLIYQIHWIQSTSIAGVMADDQNPLMELVSSLYHFLFPNNYAI